MSHGFGAVLEMFPAGLMAGLLGANVTSGDGLMAGLGLSGGVQHSLVAVILILLAIVIVWKLRQYIVNSILGIIALTLLGFVGINIPINIVTFLIAAVLGLVGVGIMIILTLLGFHF